MPKPEIGAQKNYQICSAYAFMAERNNTRMFCFAIKHVTDLILLFSQGQGLAFQNKAGFSVQIQ